MGIGLPAHRRPFVQPQSNSVCPVFDMIVRAPPGSEGSVSAAGLYQAHQLHEEC
jgi:hypothetical protein